MKIGKKEVGNFYKPYVIAEIGANHNGDMDLAKKLIDSAIECGADAVKFQSWNETSLISKVEYENNQKYEDSPKKHFGSLREMVKKYYLREDQHFMLKEYCDNKGIDFCSTPFSANEVDLLEEVGVPFYKIASMDINNFELIKYISQKGKPVILSTGMSTFSEIEKAIRVIEDCGNNQIVILHCISIYPPNPDTINLKNITMLQEMFPKYPIGFSDHSIGVSIPIAAIALGASVIEKHFTLDKNLPGWDHLVSADPGELKYIVDEGEIVSRSLGSYYRVVSKDEENKKGKFRRSIVLKRRMNKGEKISIDDVDFKRPGTKIRPDELNYVLGRVLSRDMEEDELLDWNDLI